MFVCEFSQEPLQCLHLYLGGLFFFEVAHHGNAQRAYVVAVRVACHHVVPSCAAFVDLARLVDNVVVANVPPSFARGVVLVDRAHALHTWARISHYFLRRVVHHKHLDVFAVLLRPQQW